MHRRRIAFAPRIPLIVALVLTGCAGGQPSSTGGAASNTTVPYAAVAPTPAPTRAPTPTPTPAPTPAPSSPFDGQAVDIVAVGGLFSPTEIRVAAGSELEIRFENQDPYNHAIYIVVGAVRPSVTTGEALAASVFRGAYVGGPATYAYRVPALTPGTYTFLCPPHEPMSGTIVVEE